MEGPISVRDYSIPFVTPDIHELFVSLVTRQQLGKSFYVSQQQDNELVIISATTQADNSKIIVDDKNLEAEMKARNLKDEEFIADFIDYETFLKWKTE